MQCDCDEGGRGGGGVHLCLNKNSDIEGFRHDNEIIVTYA